MALIDYKSMASREGMPSVLAVRESYNVLVPVYTT